MGYHSFDCTVTLHESLLLSTDYKGQDSFYKSLTLEQNKLAHLNEYDLDRPQSIDFDLLVEKLKELKNGCELSKYAGSLKLTALIQTTRRDSDLLVCRTPAAEGDCVDICTTHCYFRRYTCFA